MTVIALANVLRDGVMRARFHGEPIIQATELLLQERVPRDVAVARPAGGRGAGAAPTCGSSWSRPSVSSRLRTTPRLGRTCSRTAGIR